MRHLAEAGGKEPNPATVRELLRYHQRTGRILAVRRGLFATVPPGSTPESAPIDAFLAAAMGCPEVVLAYHTALELHGLAYSSFEEVQSSSRVHSGLGPSGAWAIARSAFANPWGTRP